MRFLVKFNVFVVNENHSQCEIAELISRGKQVF